MGIKRIVDTSFWTDGKVDEFTPEDKYFMLYLLTNPFSTQLGIYEISIRQAAFDLGYSVDAVKTLIDRFENQYALIYYVPETHEIAIKNFLQHSIVKGGAPVRDLLIKEMRNVKCKRLIADVFSHLQSKPTYAEMVNSTVKKIISEYFVIGDDLRYCNEKNDTYNDTSNDTYNDTYNNENDNENENENENDNENGNVNGKRRIGTDSSNKHPKGEYGHVLLSDEEEDKLIEKYGLEFALKAITFLDEYIEEKGYKSDSHYLTITRWVIDAVKEKEEKAIKNGEVPKQRYGNFDIHDAFKKAMERSYGENADKDEDEEPEQDDELKKRMEALKERIGQDA